MIKNHIHFIKTGGTIEFFDPSYDEINKRLLKLDATIDSYLKNLIQPHFSTSYESIVEKDSRDITDQDREKLFEALISSPHKNIIVTHGTFTMNQTAEYLLDKSGLERKKIIITGAMIPITGFTMSDAGFNIGFAIASFATIKPGVYLSMNGGIFKPGDIEKNENLLRFE